jgi:hypothetical protein
MGVMADARAMPGSTKIKRGIGLLLVGVLGFVLSQVLIGSDAAVVMAAGVLLAFVTLGVALVGLGLLIWGLLRD